MTKDKTEITLYVSMPDGFMETGEYRPPRANETYLAKDMEGDWSAMVSSRDHSKDSCQIILMKKPKKKVKK